MKSGANYVILANLDVDTSKVDKIIFTLRGEKNTLTKTYPTDVTEANKVFSILLYQADTQALEGTVLIEAQINFSDGAVSKTEISRLYVQQSLATELVEGNTPTGTDVRDVTFEVIGGVVIGKIVGDVDPEIIESAVKDYLDKHPVEPYDDTEIRGEISGINNSLSQKADKAEVPTTSDIDNRVQTYWNAHKSELKGDKGDKGADGINGVDGKDGQNGKDGTNGKDGSDYVITSADYDAIADVVLTKLPSAESEEF